MTEWPELPPGFSPYKQTPEYDQDTVPRGLLAEHSLKEGSWGRIDVLEGQVEVALQGCGKRRLTRAMPCYLPPIVPHQLVLCGPVRLQVVFLRREQT